MSYFPYPPGKCYVTWVDYESSRGVSDAHFSYVGRYVIVGLSFNMQGFDSKSRKSIIKELLDRIKVYEGKS